MSESSSPNATSHQHDEAWAKIHDLLAAGHWARAREIFDQATSAERDLTEVTDVCDIEIRRRMELEREIEVARENGYAAGRASTLTVPMSATAATLSLRGCAPELFGSGGVTGTLGPFGLTVHIDPKMPEGTLEFRDHVTGRLLAKIVNVGKS